jgi:NAD(P)-dependent dehydrogenase (short-subunit alcohol dehydrogenase family)
MIGKVVLITGAARGLGRALTKVFLSEGWFVIATDIDEQSMMDLNENPEIFLIRMDVTSEESVRSAYEKVKKEKINIDIIINNAGIDRYFPLSEAPVEKFKEVFEVNLFGSYRVNQSFLPLLRKPGGRIIHIGSESLNLTIPFMPYPLTKNALERYAKTLRQELKFHGIDVFVVRPGAIRTSLLESVISLHQVTKHWILNAQMQKFAEDAPKNIGKVLQPEEVARFIYKISQKSNPKAVFKINNSLQLKIAAMLPFTLLEKVILKKLKV